MLPVGVTIAMGAMLCEDDYEACEDGFLYGSMAAAFAGFLATPFYVHAKLMSAQKRLHKLLRTAIVIAASIASATFWWLVVVVISLNIKGFGSPY